MGELPQRTVGGAKTVTSDFFPRLAHSLLVLLGEMQFDTERRFGMA